MIAAEPGGAQPAQDTLPQQNPLECLSLLHGHCKLLEQEETPETPFSPSVERY